MIKSFAEIQKHGAANRQKVPADKPAQKVGTISHPPRPHCGAGLRCMEEAGQIYILPPHPVPLLVLACSIGGQIRAHFFKSVHKSAKCAFGRKIAHFFDVL